MGGVVLVTGGAGYIGSHVCKALAREGYQPVCYDDLSSGHEWAVRWGPLVRGDVRDRSALQSAFERHRPTAVAHLAALIQAGEAEHDPAGYESVNLGGTEALLEAMAAAGVARLVHSSTCGIYGARDEALAEDAALAPAGVYGRTKLAAERAIVAAAPRHGIAAQCLRYFNAAGADPELEIGEAHEPETHVIPLLLDVASGRRSEFALYGTDYPTPDGTCVRDYLHVADIAAAHVAALAAPVQSGSVEAYNLGNERGYSVHEVIRSCERVTGCRIPVRAAPRRPGDAVSLRADSTRARRELGWSPRHPELETMIAHAWAWHRKQATRDRPAS